MNVASISSSSSAAASFLAQQASAASDPSASAAATKAKASKAGNDPASIKKAAAQFEAIILRQLLAPAIDPIMKGGMGGKDEAGGGGGVYGFMLTDTLATSLSKGGGIGLASMLEKQFAPRASSSPALTTSAALKANPLSTPST